MNRSSAAPARLPLRTTLAALGAGLVLTLVAAPAYAHDELQSSNPADGTTLANPPAQVVLTFNEAPVSLGAQVVVAGPTGKVSAGAPRLDGLTVVQDLAPSAPAGPYTVAWRVTSVDGHPISGTFTFSASAAAPGGAPSPGAPSAEAPAASATPAPAEAPRPEPLIPSWGWIAAGVIAIVAAIRLNRRASAANKQQED